ncbi:MAG: flagellar biosynthesis protein FliW [Helicobacteraceae bacterium CG2_30_36_10]|nr:MAG: flagellar biosynthesis protein FliW [Helicobacteraceae bacterium CG2_30_36_10]
MKFEISAPLLGFETLKEVELQKIDDIFMKMQSTEDKHISFTLIDPFVLVDYDFEIPEKIRELLEIDKDSNLLILNILLIQTPIEDSMVNFIGPLVFNTNNHKAAQIILTENNKFSMVEKISTYLKK